LMNYWKSEEGGGDKLNKVMAEFLPTIVKVVRAANSGEQEVLKLYNKYYRWVCRHDVTMRSDVCVVYKDFLIYHLNKEHQHPKGDMFHAMYEPMLQIWKDGQWQDWLYVTQSRRVGGGVGLFAARRFDSGMILGPYVGPEVHRSVVAGAPHPTGSEVPVDSRYALTYRNFDGMSVVVDPQPPHAGKGKPMYMGLHYANSAELSFADNTEERSKAAQDQNTIITEYGCFMVAKRIEKDNEILVSYDGTECKRRAPRQGGEAKQDGKAKGAAKKGGRAKKKK